MQKQMPTHLGHVSHGRPRALGLLAGLVIIRTGPALTILLVLVLVLVLLVLVLLVVGGVRR